MIRIPLALALILSLASYAQAAPRITTVPDIIPEQSYVSGMTYYGTKAPAPAANSGSLAANAATMKRQDDIIRNGMADAKARHDAQFDAVVNGLVTGVMQGPCSLMSGFDCAAAGGIAFGPR